MNVVAGWRLPLSWLAAMVPLMLLANPARSEKASWAEIGAAAVEIGVDQFESSYGKVERYAVPDDVQGPAKAMLEQIQQRRERLVAQEAIHEAGSATLRTYIVGTGLLIGTAGGAPLVGMAVADSVYTVVETTMLQPAIEGVRRQYDADVASLVATALDPGKDLANLQELAKSNASPEQVKQEANAIWDRRNSVLNENTLAGLPGPERRLVFDQGVRSLLTVLAKTTDTKFDLTDQQISALKGQVGQVRSELRKVEQKQEAIVVAFEQHVAETKKQFDKVEKDMGAMRADMRFLQENVHWQQLGTTQKIAALQMGWFPELSDEERKQKVEQLKTVRQLEQIGEPAAVASEVAGGILKAAEFLKLPDTGECQEYCVRGNRG